MHYDNDTVAESLAVMAVQNDWGLFELVPDSSSLEDIFVELTSNEPEIAAESDSQEEAAA